MAIKNLSILLICTIVTGLFGFLPSSGFFGQTALRIAFLLLADISIVAILSKGLFFQKSSLKEQRVSNK